MIKAMTLQLWLSLLQLQQQLAAVAAAAAFQAVQTRAARDSGIATVPAVSRAGCGTQQAMLLQQLQMSRLQLCAGKWLPPCWMPA